MLRNNAKEAIVREECVPNLKYCVSEEERLQTIISVEVNCRLLYIIVCL